jgi:hypothetical protein
MSYEDEIAKEMLRFVIQHEDGVTEFEIFRHMREWEKDNPPKAFNPNFWH